MNARLRLEKLKRRTDRIARGVAGAGNHAVRVAALAHQAGIVHIILLHLLLRALRRDALLCTELDELVDILLLVRIVERIDKDSPRQIEAFPVLLDLLRRADDHETGDALLQNLLRRLERSFVHRLRKNDRLQISLCLRLDLINKSHRVILSFHFCIHIFHYIARSANDKR